MSKNLTFESSETRKNLEAAFAGESMANRKYLYFAKLARELGDTAVAEVFEDTAGQEPIPSVRSARRLNRQASLN